MQLHAARLVGRVSHCSIQGSMCTVSQCLNSQCLLRHPFNWERTKAQDYAEGRKGLISFMTKREFLCLSDRDASPLDVIVVPSPRRHRKRLEYLKASTVHAREKATRCMPTRKTRNCLVAYRSALAVRSTARQMCSVACSSRLARLRNTSACPTPEEIVAIRKGLPCRVHPMISPCMFVIVDGNIGYLHRNEGLLGMVIVW